ncbi:serine hydrolase [Jiangella ureilytica]|uniref:Serine hydrolase n=1 Tax=Jiangella ureilytica TaxID=2530374 RepID=A0A4R4RSU0_9ACTN|nr:serine hydrolase [Jiangella ureilytica]TDC51513.1 serine hydrolase [Jiangella ureilytica]
MTTHQRWRAVLDDAGLDGSFVVRDLDDGAELALEPDVELPIASLVKLPLALATLERVRRGELDGARPVEVAPGRSEDPGPTGITRFRHPARVALDDLVYLSASLSDSSATDALFDLTPPARVAALLGELGIAGFTLRHRMDALMATPAEALRGGLRHDLAIGVTERGGGSAIAELDVARANTATARALAGFLTAVWTSGTVDDGVALRLRQLMAANVHRARLAPEFVSDASTWSSKTGTLLNLRHEAGVVEHADGHRYAVVALTRSRVAAAAQPAAEIAMGRVARGLHDELRGR